VVGEDALVGVPATRTPVKYSTCAHTGAGEGEKKKTEQLVEGLILVNKYQIFPHGTGEKAQRMLEELSEQVIKGTQKGLAITAEKMAAAIAKDFCQYLLYFTVQTYTVYMYIEAGIEQIILRNGRERGRDKKILVVIRPLESVLIL
jgi:hypothetical protein